MNFLKSAIVKICFCLLFLCYLPIQSVEASERTVRVAFLPDMYGFWAIEENGNYSGYNYDYLTNLAQHTGWDIEFVVIEEGLVSTSLVKAQEMLEAGEIDLLGPFSGASSNFDDFESGERPYGVYRYNLYSARNRYAITRDNYFLQDYLRVALVEPYEDLNESFLSAMEDAGIELDITYVQTHGESHDLLYSEDVEVLLNLDMSINAETLDYLTTIQRIPFYFVSTKGNTELIAELDEGISRVEIAEPSIHQVLLEKYFGTKYVGEFMFTEEEQKQLAKYDVLKVGLLENVPPYQYVDKNGNDAGISLDILELLQELIGVPLEICWFSTHDQLSEAISNQEVDLVATLPNDYSLGSDFGVLLTNPVLSSTAYWLRNVNETENPQILRHFVSSTIPFFDDSTVNTTFNIEADLNALNNDGSTSIFCDPYIMAYYLSLHSYDNMEVKAVTNVLSEISFGVCSHLDINLLGMLNRAILYLDSYQIDEIIFTHTNVKPEYTYLDFFSDNALTINLGIFVVVGVILLSVINTSRKFRDLSRQDSLTKLYNAGYFHEYAEHKTPSLSAGALLLVDIDFFKDVNDTYGHHKGDEVIRSVASHMRRICEKTGFHARVGGDEFAIYVEGVVDKQELEQSCQRFLDEMAKNETGIVTTLSIGGFLIETPTDYTNLYKNADQVLYKVKEEGRNGYLISNNIDSLKDVPVL